MNFTGFFTALPEHRLPDPPVPLRVILTTHLALITAFELLRETPLRDSPSLLQMRMTLRGSLYHSGG